MVGAHTEVLQFRPKAHILILLGEELIKNPVMAIYELIKNGYDADAREVKVDFESIDDPKKAVITISDNGTGITEDVLKNVWFEPGTDFRKPLRADGTREIKRSPIYKRIPMGEKGVGRFAVHKLSNYIILVTRPAEVILDDNKNVISVEPLDYELHVNIDWKTFSQKKYLQDVNITWRKITDPADFRFKNSSGTYIRLSDLKETWTRGMARQLKRNTLSMLSPKNDNKKFKISLDFHNWWLNDFPSVEEILESAPYKLTAFLDADYNLTFEYEFSLKNNLEIGKREISENTVDQYDKVKYLRNIKGELRPFVRGFYEKNKEIESDNEVEILIDEFLKKPSDFGSLMLEIYSFDLDAQSLRDTTSNPTLVKDLLKDHAGIKVFKGDLRVYDYGEPGNDWLGLDLKRVQNKDWFSNNQICGFVYLDPQESGSLIEKTNREGFILNDSFERLVLLLEFILTEFKAERSSDRKHWLAFNQKSSAYTFERELTSFKKLINETEFNDSSAKNRLLLEAGKIESRYEQDKSSLLIPAGVGMTASFAIHEIEKLVPRLQESVKDRPINSAKMQEQIDELKDYVDGVLSILKKGGIKAIPLLETINQAIRNYSLRLKLRNISVTVDADLNIEFINCDKRLLITILMNLIDNSIYWLDTVFRDKKSIYISTRKNGNNIIIIVADNGPGFKDKIEDIVKPFFSRKEGGIGIGMYLVDTAMMQFGRLNIIYDKEELLDRGVPDEYNGAAVELIFNKQ